jgi:hypothetical protein
MMAFEQTETTELWSFYWRDDIGQWASGKVCYVGKWKVGKVAYTSRSKGDTEHDGAFMYLPGLKECLGYFANQEEAKRRVEQAAAYWLKELSAPSAK